MNKLMTESDWAEHNMSSNVHEIHQNSDLCKDYLDKIKLRNPWEFNTVRLNEPKNRYKPDVNSSAGNIKATKK
jgi:hypothetical protein